MDGPKDRYHRVVDCMRIEETTRIVAIAPGMGISKIRITGREPLVRKNLPRLIQSISRIESITDISLTTNGTRLKEQAQALAGAGLRRVNVSLDSLDPDRYAAIRRGDSFHDVMEGIMAAQQAGLDPIKINVVPMRGMNERDIEGFVRLALNSPFHIRFIELMLMRATRLWDRHKRIPSSEIMARVFACVQLVPIKTSTPGPARNFRPEGGRGVIGFISPMTHCFCQSCNRLRLTADGKLLPCLFSNSEVDLRPAMSPLWSDAHMERLLRLAVMMKPAGHGVDAGIPPGNSKPMSGIGG